MTAVKHVQLAESFWPADPSEALLETTLGDLLRQCAAETPDRIFKAFADPAIGLQPYQARQLAFSLGLTGDQVGKAVKMFLALYKAFIATDASMIEINPLILTKGGDLLALDAKVSFDDNALYRHPDLRELRDLTEEDPLEVEASKYS